MTKKSGAQLQLEIEDYLAEHKKTPVAAPAIDPALQDRIDAFEAKREAKRERLEAASARAAGEASARFGTAHRIGSMIPMGQPILVGHHSEKPDTRQANHARAGQAVQVTRKASTSDRAIVKRAIGGKLRATRSVRAMDETEQQAPRAFTLPSIVVDAEITFFCEKVGKAPFVARFYDRITCQFYSGSGPTSLEAIAWCMDEYVNRGVLGRGPMPARNGDARPGDFARASLA